MSVLALTTAGILLVSSPTVSSPMVSTGPSNTITSPKQTDAVWIAAHGGFLVGNAHRCGIDTDRVVKAGQLVQMLIAAASRDEDEASDAGGRFAEFFLATAFPSKETSLVASCKTIGAELTKLERHQAEASKAMAKDAGKDKTMPMAGSTPAPTPSFQLSDGE